MSRLLLLALLGLVAAQLPRELRYEFDGQIAVTLPSYSEAAATRVKCDVVVLPTSDRNLRLMLKNFKFAVVKDVDASKRIAPIEEFELMQIEKEHLEILEKPFSFNYKRGLVGEIRFSALELSWTANIKRSVINMLQVNLGKDETSYTSDKSSFVTVERSIEGECETTYTKVSKGEQEQWTKSVDLNKCTLRPETRYGRRFTTECEECKDITTDNQFGTTVYNFNITNVDRTPLVQSAQLTSRQLFAAIDQEQFITANGYVRMNLVYSGEVRTRIPEADLTKTENIIFDNTIKRNLENFERTGEEKYLREFPERDTTEMARQILPKLGKQLEDMIDGESSHYFSRLVRLIRLAREDQLRKIEQIVPENVRVFDDALALAGTKNTLNRLYARIQDGTVSPIKAAQLMKAVAELSLPSLPIAEELFSFCESSVVSRNPVLRQSCWLSYGSVLNGLCGVHTDKLAVHDKQCTSATKVKLIQQIVEKIERTDSHYDQVLFIKVLGNSAIDKTVQHLEKIIRESNQVPVRVQAIDALRRLRTALPRKLVSVLMPIYKDQRLQPEIRIAALNVLLQSQPDQKVLSDILFTVRQDRSRQVRSFTISAIESWSKSTNPCEKKFATRCSVAMSMVKELNDDVWWRSGFDRVEKYTKYHGTTLNFATMFSNDSFLPKEISASVDALFAGEWNKYLAQIGMTQANIDDLLAQVLQKVEKEGIENLITRGKRSTAMSFNPREIISNLISNLRFGRRTVEPKEPQMMLYFRYKDLDYAFLPIDKETIPDFFVDVVREGKLNLNVLEKYVKDTKFTSSIAGFIHETSRSIPSVIGLPIVMSSKMPTLFSVRGQANLKMDPIDGEIVNGLRSHVIVKPQVASNHLVKVEVFSPIAASGFKLVHSIRLDLPIDAELSLNWEGKVMFSSKFNMPEYKHHLLHVSSRPATFIRVFKKEQHLYPEALEKTLVLEESPLHKYESEMFNKNMKVVGHIRYPLLFADSSVDVVIEPADVKQLTFALTTQLFEGVNEMSRPKMNILMKQTDEHVNRDELSRYLENIDMTKAVSHRIEMLAEAKGNHRHAAQLSINAKCTTGMIYCKVNTQANVNVDDSKKWEITANTETVVPETPTSMKNFKEHPFRHIAIQSEVEWNRDGRMTVGIIGKQSPEQKRWIERADRDQSDITEQQKLIKAGQLNEYVMVADYGMEPKVENLFNNMLSYIRAYYFLSTTVVPSSERNGLTMKLSIEPNQRQYFNWTIKSQKYETIIENAQVPFKLPTVSLGRMPMPENWKQVADKVEKKNRAECTLKDDEVNTFDSVIYRVPITNCYSVLAKDCNSEKPRFVVMVKNVKKDKKALRVMDGEKYVIDMEVVEDEMQVLVNGEKTFKYEKYGITHHGEVYRINLHDIEVRFDGFVVETKLSPFFMNKQCGLCGHYDNEDGNDFRRADNEETEDIEEFHRSFLYDDGDCDREERRLSDKKQYKLLSKETSSSEEYNSDETREPVMKTRVVERRERLCFSEKPQKECPKGTRGSEFEEMEMSFKCIRRSEHTAKKLSALLREQRDISEELLELDDTWSSYKSVPTVCVY